MKSNMHPGQLLLDTMLAMDWKVSELATRMGCDVELVRDLLLEFEDVTPTIAEQMSKATGISAKLFLNLQRTDDETHNSQPIDETVPA